MQKFVRFLAQGFAKELLVKFNDVWIFVRFADGFVHVLTINSLHPFLKDLKIAMMQWLTTASDASTGACHDLDGMELALAGLNVLKQFTCIPKAVGYADIDW